MSWSTNVLPTTVGRWTISAGSTLSGGILTLLDGGTAYCTLTPSDMGTIPPYLQILASHASTIGWKLNVLFASLKVTYLDGSVSTSFVPLNEVDNVIAIAAGDFTTLVFKITNISTTTVVFDSWALKPPLSTSGFLTQYSIDGLTNWHDTFADEDVYMRLSGDDGVTWSISRIVGEGQYTDYWFAVGTSAPTKPGDNVATPSPPWYADPPTPGAGQLLYMTKAIKKNDGTCLYPTGTWSTPVALSGEDGEAAVIITQYSINGSTLWHDTWVAGDLYMRVSSDDGGTWEVMRIVGEQGATGTSGRYTDYWFAVGTSAPTKPGDNVATPSPPWYASPPTPGTGESLYMTKAIKNADGSCYYPTNTWSTPVVLTGPKGDDGTPASVLTEYSVDGSTFWHDTWEPGDLYMSISYNGGGSWETMRIVGEQGAVGIGGRYTDYWFAVGTSAPTKPGDNVATPSPPWYSSPPTPGAGEFLYMTRAEKNANGTCYSPTNTWSTPVKLTGPAAVATLAQYSITGSGSWHDTWVTGDLYMRISTDGGTTWVVSRIVGEQGATGTTGNFFDYWFAVGTSAPTKPGDNVATPSVPWYASPPTPGANEFLYMTKAVKKYDGSCFYAVNTWSTPTRLSGPQGPVGETWDTVQHWKDDVVAAGGISLNDTGSPGAVINGTLAVDKIAAGSLTAATTITAGASNNKIVISGAATPGVGIFGYNGSATPYLSITTAGFTLIGGSITGSTIRTAASPNARAEMTTAHDLDFYDSSNVLMGSVIGEGGSYAGVKLYRMRQVGYQSGFGEVACGVESDGFATVNLRAYGTNSNTGTTEYARLLMNKTSLELGFREEGGASLATLTMNAANITLATSYAGFEISKSAATITVAGIMSLAVPWTNMPWYGSWSNYGSPYEPAQYCKDAFGFVHLKGRANYAGSALNGTYIIAILPSGCQPAGEIFYPVRDSSTSGIGWIQILADGTVQMYLSVEPIFLDGVIFRAG